MQVARVNYVDQSAGYCAAQAYITVAPPSFPSLPLRVFHEEQEKETCKFGKASTS